MPRNILYIASTASHIRHFHLPYLKALTAQGDRVTVVCGGEGAPFPQAAETVFLPFEKRMTAAANFRCAGAIRRLVRERNIDLMLLHTSLAAFFARLGVMGLGKRPRVVNVVHGYLFDDDTPWKKRQILLGAEKLTAGVTDEILVMNGADEILARRHRLAPRVEKIPGMGVDYSAIRNADAGAAADLRRRLGIGPGDCMLLYGAEFSRRKNQAMLLRMLARLPEDFYLVLPGEGAELAACRRLAEELGVDRRVRFPGYVTDMAVYDRAADLVTASSRSEGLPFHLMEAMAAGKPAVATRVKGHTDLLDGLDLLVPYDDDEAMARTVLELWRDGARRAKAGAELERRSGAYALDRVEPRVMALYNAVPFSGGV